jgi:phosphoribosylformylglycinamidine cyclo-ligase
VLFEQMGLTPKSRLPGLPSTVGEELLRVHVSYGRLIQALLRRFNGDAPVKQRTIKAFAHITGGGFVDNVPRVLPPRCDVIIRKGSWPVLPIFQVLQEKGGIDEAEMYQVFNMGIGMVAVVDPGIAEKVIRFAERRGVPAWTIGEVVRGGCKVKLQ